VASKIPPGVLREMLIAKGVMSRRGTTRRARIGFCKHCKAKVLQGWDGDVAAFDVDVDLELNETSKEVYILSTIRRTLDYWKRDKPLPGGGTFYILLSGHECKER
jgi:hypothetical protein